MKKIYQYFYQSRTRKIAITVQLIAFGLATLDNFKTHTSINFHLALFLIDIFAWFIMVPCIVYFLRRNPSV
jgi:hypothetical protein